MTQPEIDALTQRIRDVRKRVAARHGGRDTQAYRRELAATIRAEIEAEAKKASEASETAP